MDQVLASTQPKTEKSLLRDARGVWPTHPPTTRAEGGGALAGIAVGEQRRSAGLCLSLTTRCHRHHGDGQRLGRDLLPGARLWGQQGAPRLNGENCTQFLKTILSPMCLLNGKTAVRIP